MPFSLAMIAKARKGVLEEVFSKRKIVDKLPESNVVTAEEKKFMKNSKKFNTLV